MPKAFLEFKSPVIIGKKRSATNFVESRGYIPGSIVRAALAKYIVLNCKAVDDVWDSDLNKLFWVKFRDNKECKTCNIKNLCIKFSDIKISFFYPKGTKPNPLCRLLCKNNEEHGFFSDLLKSDDEAVKCSECSCKNSRVEKYAGLICDNKPYNGLKKAYLGKTAINSFTRTALKGSLFTLVPIVKTCDEGLIFEGEIDGISLDDLNAISEIRIGKYTSSGFGRACIKAVLEDQKDSIDEIKRKAKSFSDDFKEVAITNEDKHCCEYIVLYFTSDILFKIDEPLTGYISTEEYLGKIKSAIGIPDEFFIERIYSQIGLYRGVDTSSKEKREKDIMYLAQSGTVLVLRTKLTIDDAIDKLLQIEGFGESTSDGYGRFEIYFNQG